MQVFIFDPLPYSEHLDHLVEAESCRGPCRGAMSSPRWRCARTQSTSRRQTTSSHSNHTG